MEEFTPDQKRAGVILVVIIVLAVLAVVSLLVAFSYYCYIRSKVSKRFKPQKSELFLSFSTVLPLTMLFIGF